MRPSQWINFGWFLFGIGGGIVLFPLGPAALIPMGIFLWKYIEVAVWKYEFGEETIVEHKGVFRRIRSEITYYRIKSVQVDEPLLYRLVGISKLHIITSDQFTENFTFVGLRAGQALRQDIRTMVHLHRGQKGVKEFDLYEL